MLGFEQDSLIDRDLSTISGDLSNSPINFQIINLLALERRRHARRGFFLFEKNCNIFSVLSVFEYNK